MVKLSVLLTAYNTEKYISQCLKSILSQTFSDFELIIVDDGSTDRTVDIIQSFKDKRIKLYKLNANYGVGYANRFALTKATGKYIAKVDSDDLIESTRFQTQVDYLDNNSQIDVVDSFIDYFADDLEVLSSDRFGYYENIKTAHVNQKLSANDLSKQLYIHCVTIHGAIMARKEPISKVNYNSKFRIGEDYALFYELNKLGHKFYKIPKVLTKVRISANSTTATLSKEYFESIFLIKLEEIKKLIQNNSKPLAIWGAGELGVIVKALLEKSFNVKPSIFIDTFAQKNQVTENISVKRPGQVKLAEYKIIVASSPGKLEISDKLDNEGLIFLQDYMVFI